MNHAGHDDLQRRSRGDVLSARLQAATPHALGLRMLSRDPVAAELPADAQHRLVLAALDDGAAVGAMLRARHPALAPEQIAAALGIAVVRTRESPLAGPFWRHADYRSRPPEIRLFSTALAALNTLLEQDRLGDCLGIADTAAIFVAHELYHHVDATREEPPLARRHAVTRLRLGPLRLDAPVLAMPEIAAGACAQALLGLRHHAAILDVVLLSRSCFAPSEDHEITAPR